MPATPPPFTVDPRTLTVGLTGTVEKTYDGGTAASLASGNYSLGNVFGADDVHIATTAGQYDTATAGTGKTVMVTGLTLGGSKAADYSLAVAGSSGAVGMIDKKLLTVTAANQRVNFGRPHPGDDAELQRLRDRGRPVGADTPAHHHLSTGRLPAGGSLPLATTPPAAAAP